MTIWDHERKPRPASKINRRSFIQAAGGTAALTAGVIAASESQAAASGKWDHETDIVVIGTGASGLTAAITAASEGARIIILESAPVAGGASSRSGAGYWIPNNRYMREAGLQDPREDALRYMCRYSFTQLYDPNAPFYGIPESSYHLIAALYDNAAPAIESLERLGALQTKPDMGYDYWDHAPENKAPYGRLLRTRVPGDDFDYSFKRAELHPATAVTPEWYGIVNSPRRQDFPLPTRGQKPPPRPGVEMIRQLTSWLEKNKVPIMFEHRAVRLVTNKKREVVGVEATTDEGQKVVTIRTRKAVLFGSGGFTQNAELALNFQRGPTFGSCGPVTNQGDFVYMATDIGAKLGNMQNAWNIQVILDHNIQTPAIAADVWFNPGDAMFVVNKLGKRVVDEKRPYNDRAEVHYNYDPGHEEWINLVLFYIYDDRVATLAAGRSPIPPKGTIAPYVITGSTIEELASGISERLSKYASKLGGFKLDSSFVTNCKETLTRFNRFAETGIDEDFGRGRYRYDQQWHELSGGHEEWMSNDKPNKTMYPLSTTGPYHAILIAKSQADTNGGPVINAKGQILSIRNQPIPGLYGAGNCIAAPSGRAYYGGGGTLGPAFTFAYIAGKNAAKETLNEDSLSHPVG